MGALQTTKNGTTKYTKITKKAGTTEYTEYTEEWTERDVGIPHRGSERGQPGPAIRFCISLALILGGRMVDPAHAVDERVLGLRQEYNAVAAQIDSVVWAMGVDDRSALDMSRLPIERDALVVPRGDEVVMIFWADDEAKVWLNDYFVGETRLTPVEVVVPSLYLSSTNRIRVRCWDTDWVESGFLLGLYLRSEDGTLHPIVTSDGSWEGVGGPVEEIAYAHSLPDIPEAEVVWGPRVFGLVEMTRTFDGSAVERASTREGSQGSGATREMRYHDFVARLAMLESERMRLTDELADYAVASAVPGFVKGAAAPGLTLGRAGPLEEDTSRPVSEEIDRWVKTLAPTSQAMVYPDRRRLRGEDAATDAGTRSPSATREGDRTGSYRPPSDRRNTQPGAEAGLGLAEGDGEAGSPARTGGGGGGRPTRLALLIPTGILTAYVLFAVLQLRREWFREAV